MGLIGLQVIFNISFAHILGFRESFRFWLTIVKDGSRNTSLLEKKSLAKATLLLLIFTIQHQRLSYRCSILYLSIIIYNGKCAIPDLFMVQIELCWENAVKNI